MLLKKTPKTKKYIWLSTIAKLGALIGSRKKKWFYLYLKYLIVVLLVSLPIEIGVLNDIYD